MPPRPPAGSADRSRSRKDRDGLALGEGRRDHGRSRATRRARWRSTDRLRRDLRRAHHLTSPAPDGARARCCNASRMKRTQATRHRPRQRAHGTATLQNDAAEARAIASLGLEAPTFSFKGTVGHARRGGARDAGRDRCARKRVVASDGANRLKEGRRAARPRRGAGGRDERWLAIGVRRRERALVVTLDDRRQSRRRARARSRTSRSRAPCACRAPGRPRASGPRRAQQIIPVDRITRADDLVRYAHRGGGRASPLDAWAICARSDARGRPRARHDRTNTKFPGAHPATRKPRRFRARRPNAAAGECAAVAFRARQAPQLRPMGGGPRHGGLRGDLGGSGSRAGGDHRTRGRRRGRRESATASEDFAPGTTSGTRSAARRRVQRGGRITGGASRPQPAPPPSPSSDACARGAESRPPRWRSRELVAEVPGAVARASHHVERQALRRRRWR